MLDQRGLRPNKRFGQNFLVDGNLMRRLVAEAELGAEDVVLEVGGGTGALTDLLAARAGRVICVEIDRELFPILEDTFRDRPNVRLIHGDILSGKHELAHEVLDALQPRERGSSASCDGAGCRDGGGGVKLVANLPYQVATPLLFNLLLDHPCVRRMVFTVQLEVGGRIMAAPGGKDYGPLSIVVQLLARASVVAKLPPHVFWPRPSVESVMLRLDLLDAPFLSRTELRPLLSLLRGTFDHRRKTLRSALAYVLDAEAIDAVCREFDGTRRPETLGPREWIHAYETVKARLAFRSPPMP